MIGKDGLRVIPESTERAIGIILFTLILLVLVTQLALLAWLLDLRRHEDEWELAYVFTLVLPIVFIVLGGSFEAWMGSSPTRQGSSLQPPRARPRDSGDSGNLDNLSCRAALSFSEPRR